MAHRAEPPGSSPLTAPSEASSDSSTPPQGLPLPLPMPSGPPAALQAPHPVTTAEFSHPAVIGKLAHDEPDDEALAVLATLSPESLAPPSFLEPIGLPDAARLSVLALFQDRAAIWDRLDVLRTDTDEFQRAIQRAFGSGVTPTIELPDASGDPEAEVMALRTEVESTQDHLRELTAAVAAKKIEIQRLRQSGPGAFKIVAIVMAFVAAVAAGVTTLLF